MSQMNSMMPLYLNEIRLRIWWTLGFYLFFFICCFIFHSSLTSLFLVPLRKTLLGEHQLISNLISPAIAPIYFSGYLSLLFTFPVLFYHIWRFVRPALKKEESLFMLMVLFFSQFLFLSGVFFSYRLILPFLFELFIKMIPVDIHYFPDFFISIQFMIKMMIYFGLCFQLPLLMIIAVRAELVRYKTLIKIRPYTIVCAFIIGMLLTPPDVLSQVIVALPLCLLYELAMLILWLFFKFSPNQFTRRT